MTDTFSELLEVREEDMETAGQFFKKNIIFQLRERGEKTQTDEIRHVASAMAHFALTSCSEDNLWSAPTNLNRFFERFVLPDRSFPEKDLEFLLSAATQSLFLTGFCREHFKRKYSVEWCEKIGARFYFRAGQQAEAQRDLFFRLSVSFWKWARILYFVSRDLQENQHNRLLLQIPPPSPPTIFH